MLERMNDLPEGLDGVRASGCVTREDYRKVLLPMLDEARRDGRRIRLAYELGPEVEGFTAGAAWEDARVGLRYLRLFERCAVITDLGWARNAVRLTGGLLPCPVEVFGTEERDRAIEWLGAPATGPAISHRLLTDSGVLLVEPDRRLRAEDFDALALTVDPFIEARGELSGLVIHATAFPGWEDLGSAIRHLQFVRDHQRKVRRVALATDARVARIAPAVAEHLVNAEVRQFPYDELDAALAWAGGGAREAETTAQPTAAHT